MRSGRVPGAGRFLLKAAAAVAVVVVLLVVATGAAVYRAGLLVVDVEEKREDGSRIVLPIPVALLHAGLVLVPEASWPEAGAAGQQWLPVVRAACTGLDRSPDGVLVLVESPGERVSIVKKGRSLVIDVDTPDERVHVSIPVRAAGNLAARLLAPRGGSRAVSQVL